VLTFPTALFKPGTLRKRIVGASIGGGQSVSGVSQSAATSAGGHWVFELEGVNLWDRAKFNTWEGIAAIEDNGATQFVVPICDRIHQPFGDPKRLLGIGNGDDSVFDDGALWAAEQITASITGSAALRATRLTIACDHTVEVGNHFTGWHLAKGQRMYRIAQVHGQGGGSADISIRPPLRQATSDGFPLDFDNPRSVMTVQGDMSATLEMLKRGSGKVTFQESFGPVDG